jgi:hypothetical protein
MIGITLSWRLRPLGHLTVLNLVDSMEELADATYILLWLLVGEWSWTMYGWMDG